MRPSLGGELYLVFDQIEEYFVYHGATAAGRSATRSPSSSTRPDLRVHVLLGIRDDALARLDAFKARVPGLFANVLRLDHLDRDAGPRGRSSDRSGGSPSSVGPRVEAEPALVDAVLDEVASGRIDVGLVGRGVAGDGATRTRSRRRTSSS